MWCMRKRFVPTKFTIEKVVQGAGTIEPRRIEAFEQRVD